MQKHLFKTGGLWKRCAIISALFLFAAPPLAAKELKDILKHSLIADPALLEARAMENAAKSTTKATQAGHYPVLTLTGTSAINGTGNALDNILTGNSANNVLTGETGADTRATRPAAATASG